MYKCSFAIQKLGFVAYDMRPEITFHVQNKKTFTFFHIL